MLETLESCISINLDLPRTIKRGSRSFCPCRDFMEGLMQRCEGGQVNSVLFYNLGKL